MSQPLHGSEHDKARPVIHAVALKRTLRPRSHPLRGPRHQQHLQNVKRATVALYPPLSRLQWPSTPPALRKIASSLPGTTPAIAAFQISNQSSYKMYGRGMSHSARATHRASKCRNTECSEKHIWRRSAASLRALERPSKFPARLLVIRALPRVTSPKTTPISLLWTPTVVRRCICRSIAESTTGKRSSGS